MKLPAKARVAGYDCKIIRTKFEYDAEGFANWGAFCTDTYEIEIAESEHFKDDALIASTVIHELGHAINCIYGLPDDEKMVRKVEMIVVQILRDNKTLFRRIIRAL